MKCEWYECVIPFSDGSEDYKERDKVLVVKETPTKYGVGTDYCRIVEVDKKYLKKIIT